MKTYGIGHDHGNSRNTDVIYINGQEQLVAFPSMIAEGSLHRLAEVQRGGGIDLAHDRDALKNEKEAYVISLNGTEHFVGKLALEQGANPSDARGEVTRYWSSRSLEMLLVSAGSKIPENDFDLTVVTGLPIFSFNSTTRDNIKRFLTGTHSFTLNGRERTAYIGTVNVLMEGAGASLLNKSGDKLYGVIDIGGYSTDFYGSKGLKPVEVYCKGIEVGVEDALDIVSGKFEDRYGYPLSQMRRGQIKDWYLYPDRREPITAGGVTISHQEITRWMQEAFDSVMQRIFEQVPRAWRSGHGGLIGADFETVTVVGGGAYYFIRSIQQRIPQSRSLRDPEHANARGFGWLADQFVQQQQRIGLVS